MNLLSSESTSVMEYSQSPFETETMALLLTLHILGVRLSYDASTLVLLGIFIELVFIDDLDLSSSRK